MPPQQPFNPIWLEGWRRGNKEACDRACVWLWLRLYPAVSTYVTRLGVDTDLAQQIAAEAFWYAMEELDLMLGGGRVLTEALPDGQFKGKHSERVLGGRQPLVWLAENQFVALIRGMWVARCRDRLRVDEGVHEQQLAATDEAGMSGDAEASPDPGPMTPLLDRERVLALVAALAQATEHPDEGGAARQMVEKTIVYIKFKVAQCSPAFQNKPLKEIADTTIENLLKEADLRGFHPDGTEWRQCLMEWLSLSRAALDKRMERLQPLLQRTLRLLFGIGRDEVVGFVAELAQIAEQPDEGGISREIAEATIVYIKVTVGQRNQAFQSRSLEDINAIPIEETLKHTDLSGLQMERTGWGQRLMEWLDLSLDAFNERMRHLQLPLMRVLKRLFCTDVGFPGLPPKGGK